MDASPIQLADVAALINSHQLTPRLVTSFDDNVGRFSLADTRAEPRRRKYR
jgi:hypothetical protein